MNDDMSRYGAVINHCSLGQAFIEPCLEAVLSLASSVIVVACDHLLDGTPEDLRAYRDLAANYPEVKVLVYPYLPDVFSCYGSHFGINLGRWLGFQRIADNCDSLFWLDDDEVLESNAVREWFEQADLRDVNTVTFESYWYFRETRFRACTTEYAGTWTRTSFVKPWNVFSKKDRYALNGRKTVKRVLSCEGNPMMHHYSWVRSQEEMLKKVRSWGHRGERDWEALVKQEFEQPFSGQDFVHGYTFETVEPLSYRKRVDEHREASGEYPDNFEYVDSQYITAVIKALPLWLIWANRRRIW